MKKAVVAIALIAVFSSPVAGFSIIQPLPDGLSDISSDLLQGRNSSEFFQKSGDTMEGTLGIKGPSLLNYWGPDCPSGEAMQDVFDNGTLICREINASENLERTLNAGNKAGDNDINMTGSNITGVNWLNTERDWKTGGHTIEQAVNDDPEIVGHVADSTNLGSSYSVAVRNGYAYVATFSDRLTVVDITEPANPSIVGSVSDSTNLNGAVSVSVDGGYAYVAAYSGDRLTTVDISDPSSPTVEGSVSDSTNMDQAWSVDVSGSYAYVAAGASDSLAVVDVSNPSSPSVVGSVSDGTDLDGANAVSVRGDFAYVSAPNSDSMTVVNVSDASSPSLEGTVSDSSKLDLARTIDVSGSKAYVAHGDDGSAGNDDGLTVVNVSDPSDPVIAGSVLDSRLHGPKKASVSGNYAYVIGENDALTVVDISDPSSPVIAGQVSDSSRMDGPWGLDFSGGKAYVASATGDEFAVVDIPSFDLPTGSIGSLRVSELYADREVSVEGGLTVQGGVSVGQRGVKVDGEIVSESLEVTGTKNFVQQVNSTHSVVYTSSESAEAVVEWTETVEVSPEGSFVSFPSHFRHVLSGEEDYHVIAQPLDGGMVGVFGKNHSGVELKSSVRTTADVHVRGVRKGFEDAGVWRKGDSG